MHEMILTKPIPTRFGKSGFQLVELDGNGFTAQ